MRVSAWRRHHLEDEHLQEAAAEDIEQGGGRAPARGEPEGTPVPLSRGGADGREMDGR